MIKKTDIAILGAGYSGSLTALLLRQLFPGVRITLLERHSREEWLSQSMTWSFHDSDIPNSLRHFLLPLISQTWNGYNVRFPKFERKFQSRYHSIRSRDLTELLLKSSIPISFSHNVQSIRNESILSDAGQIQAQLILDCRGWSNDLGPCGFQKFVGLEVQLSSPHGLTNPLLMDAQVPQRDGFRFFYCLPWSETELLIEDTYYSSYPTLKEDRIETEILSYADQYGWKIQKILRKEKGCLPLPFFSPERPKGKAVAFGAKDAFFHAVTGYTSPHLFRQLEAMQKLSSPTPESVRSIQTQLLQKQKKQLQFFHLLNRLLFRASINENRYLVLQHFYRKPEKLVQRFYAGELTLWDQIRLLSGKPPVPLRSALDVFFHRQR